MNELSRLERELADEEDDEADEEADDDDELEPVELGAVALMLVDGEDLRERAVEADDADAAIAARMKGALMTVSTLDARK